MNTPTPCSCRVRYDKIDTNAYGICMCPLHAAAPELLAALQCVIAVLTQPVQTTPSAENLEDAVMQISVLRSDCKFAVSTARAVIAKASAQ